MDPSAIPRRTNSASTPPATSRISAVSSPAKALAAKVDKPNTSSPLLTKKSPAQIII